MPASMMPYLALDDTRAAAVDRLIAQAHTDADMTRSACDDPQDQNGQRIEALLNAMPEFDPEKAIVDLATDENSTTTNEQRGERHV